MTMGGMSHVAIGVRDMERSLQFYRDQLGMKVTRDRVEEVRPGRMYASAEVTTRRVAHLRWEDGEQAVFFVLSEFPPAPSGEAIKLDQVGIHHVALWVTGLREKAERLREAGVAFVMKPVEVDASGYDGTKGEKVATCLFEDPDGIILQFDEKLG